MPGGVRSGRSQDRALDPDGGRIRIELNEIFLVWASFHGLVPPLRRLWLFSLHSGAWASVSEILVRMEKYRKRELLKSNSRDEFLVQFLVNASNIMEFNYFNCVYHYQTY